MPGFLALAQLTKKTVKTMNMIIGSSNHFDADADMRDVEPRGGKPATNLDDRVGKSSLPPNRYQKIFLSHSGVQKPFVEQLFWDLKNRGHTPFFDKSPESLPKGMEYPGLIVQAAMQCVVAVVVLSDEYLMSKWPMLELLAFVDAKRTCNPGLRLLPLFFKLEICDLRNSTSIQRWRSEWQKLASEDARFNPKRCKDALRVLVRSNGVRFSDYGESEFRYREAIVKDLYRLSRPYVKYDRPPMTGRSRLCEKIEGELERQSRVNVGQSRVNVAVLGFYGLGGMGKTLLCKALCNHFREKYAGRVCHAERSKLSGRLDLQNMILDELTDANKDTPVGTLKTSEEAIMFQLKEHLPRQAVFLAVDNVQDDDLQWLQSIMNCAHHPDSKFVVTSRCSGIVQSIVKNKDLCWPVPTLTENEAVELFVRSAVPTLNMRIPSSYSRDQEIVKILKNCIQECFFPSDVRDPCSSAQDSGGHYSPMLLQALGSSIKEANFGLLIQKCRMWGKLQHFHKHKIFEILRTEYDALYPQRSRLLFLDVALFAPREKLRKLDDLCTWLEAMHDYSREEILHKLSEMERRSLLKTNAESHITIHEMYKDFAAYELQVVEESKSSPWAVYHESGLPSRRHPVPQNLEKSPPGKNWPDLVRVYLHIENQLPDASSPQMDLHVLQSIVLASPPVMFPNRKKIHQWANVQLLCLEGFESQVLDIGPLECLRSLKLVSYELVTLKGCNRLKQLRFVELGCCGLRKGLEFSRCSKLQELVTGEIYSLQELTLPQSSSDMKLFKFNGWNEFLPGVLDLGKLTALREVDIARTIWDTGRALSLWDWRLSVVGLQFLTKLVGLTLIYLPISSLPGLEKLVGLEFLNLHGCAKLEELPDLSNLLRLAWVDTHGCEMLKSDRPLLLPERCMRINTSREISMKR